MHEYKLFKSIPSWKYFILFLQYLIIYIGMKFQLENYFSLGHERCVISYSRFLCCWWEACSQFRFHCFVGRWESCFSKVVHDSKLLLFADWIKSLLNNVLLSLFFKVLGIIYWFSTVEIKDLSFFYQFPQAVFHPSFWWT